MRATAHGLCLLLALCGTGFGQDAKSRKAAGKPAKPAALPASQVKVLKAIVMEVRGVAQARKTSKAKWVKLKVHDTLEPGAVVRTGRKSRVALRVGMNASILIERQSRVAIPQIIQSGQVLKTRVSMSFGKADVRVDRVGLDNDFEVSTPTATLAVRGTAWRLWWDAVKGARAEGVPGNKLRAIELRYLEKVHVLLSGPATSSEKFPLPALDAYFKTYLFPLLGAVSPDELGELDQDLGYLVDPTRETSVAALRRRFGAGGLRPDDPTRANQERASEKD
ncbi:MAG: FecR domain-containing protein [Planctomycetota bacterium]|jgi:hypothetical protein